MVISRLHKLRSCSLVTALAFFWSCVGPLAFAQNSIPFQLPAPGVMVQLSPQYTPVVLKAITVHADNPFLFDFVIDVGDSKLSNEALSKESEKLVKYFLASLTVPEKDLWVNLSPYEKDRIIPDEFGKTEMGRDLLAQDYLLKQITSTLIYPEDKLGREFWNKVYAEAKAKYGTTDIPVNTFNKVWILPDVAKVYEHGQTAFVVKTHLKVMLEEDYLAFEKNSEGEASSVKSEALHVSRTTNDDKSVNALGSQIVREIIIPALEEEVNNGKNFAQVRQVYYSLILAAWFKKKLKDNILAKIYVDQKKTEGIDLSSEGHGTRDMGQEVTSPLSPVSSPLNAQDIYQQYLAAFKTGVFNYIKEDVDPDTQEVVPRKYFSGGIIGHVPLDFAMVTEAAQALQNERPENQRSVTVRLNDVSGKNIVVENPARTTGDSKVDEAMVVENQPIDQLINPQTKELKLKTLDQVVHQATKETIDALGLKPGDLEVLVVGGMRYLQNGNRKDIDLVFVIRPKNISPTQVAQAFLKQFDKIMRSFKGFGTYARFESIKDKTYFVAFPNSTGSIQEPSRKPLLLDLILPVQDPRTEKWGYKFGYLNATQEEYIMDDLGYSLTEYGRVGFETTSMIDMIKDRIKSNLAANYYLADEPEDMEEVRQQYLNAEATNDTAAFRRIVGNQKFAEQEKIFRDMLQDPNQRSRVIVRIHKRLRQPLGGDEAMVAQNLKYDFNSKTLTITDEQLGTTRTLTPIETDGGNNAIFDLGDSIIRVAYTLGRYASFTQIETIRLLGEIGASPRLLSEPGKTSNGYHFLHMEKVKGKNISDFIKENQRPLRGAEIEAMKKLFDLLIDHKIWVSDSFNPSNFMLGRIQDDAPMRAYMIDVDLVFILDNVIGLIDSYILNFKTWAKADPNQELAGYLAQKKEQFMRTGEAALEGDEAMVSPGKPDFTMSKDNRSVTIPNPQIRKIADMVTLARKWNVELKGKLNLKEGRVVSFDYPDEENRFVIIQPQSKDEFEVTEEPYWFLSSTTIVMGLKNAAERILAEYQKTDGSSSDAIVTRQIDRMKELLKELAESSRKVEINLYSIRDRQRYILQLELELDTQGVFALINDLANARWSVTTHFGSFDLYGYPDEVQGDFIDIHTHPNQSPAPPSAIAEGIGDIYAHGFFSGKISANILDTPNGDEVFFFNESDDSRKSEYIRLYNLYWYTGGNPQQSKESAVVWDPDTRTFGRSVNEAAVLEGLKALAMGSFVVKEYTGDEAMVADGVQLNQVVNVNLMQERTDALLFNASWNGSAVVIKLLKTKSENYPNVAGLIEREVRVFEDLMRSSPALAKKYFSRLLGRGFLSAENMEIFGGY